MRAGAPRRRCFVAHVCLRRGARHQGGGWGRSEGAARGSRPAGRQGLWPSLSAQPRQSARSPPTAPRTFPSAQHSGGGTSDGEDGGGGGGDVLLRRWTLGEVVTAAAAAGLVVTRLEEEPGARMDDFGVPKLFTLVAARP